MIFSNFFLKESKETQENNSNNVDRGGKNGEGECTDWEERHATAKAFCILTSQKDTEKGCHNHRKEGNRKHQTSPDRMGFPYCPILLHHLCLIHDGVVDVGSHDKVDPVVDVGEDIGSKKCCVLKVRDDRKNIKLADK